MIDRSAVFTNVLKRNALRREAGLPRLSVSDVYHKEVTRAEWLAFVTQNESDVRASVLYQQRKKFGSIYPQSAGGRWAVEIMVRQALSKRFQARRPAGILKS